jgi:hypothetical protein
MEGYGSYREGYPLRPVLIRARSAASGSFLLVFGTFYIRAVLKHVID